MKHLVGSFFFLLITFFFFSGCSPDFDSLVGPEGGGTNQVVLVPEDQNGEFFATIFAQLEPGSLNKVNGLNWTYLMFHGNESLFKMEVFGEGYRSLGQSELVNVNDTLVAVSNVQIPAYLPKQQIRIKITENSPNEHSTLLPLVGMKLNGHSIVLVYHEWDETLNAWVYVINLKKSCESNICGYQITQNQNNNNTIKKIGVIRLAVSSKTQNLKNIFSAFPNNTPSHPEWDVIWDGCNTPEYLPYYSSNLSKYRQILMNHTTHTGADNNLYYLHYYFFYGSDTNSDSDWQITIVGNIPPWMTPLGIFVKFNNNDNFVPTEMFELLRAIQISENYIANVCGIINGTLVQGPENIVAP